MPRKRVEEAESDAQALTRFQIELEFLHCLANPWYLHYLAQQQYFNDPDFVRYLDYLTYFHQPEYAKYVTYPHALFFLDLLQSPHFRQMMTTQEVTQLAHKSQFWHWVYWRNGGAKKVEANGDKETHG